MSVPADRFPAFPVSDPPPLEPDIITLDDDDRGDDDDDREEFYGSTCGAGCGYCGRCS